MVLVAAAGVPRVEAGSVRRRADMPWQVVSMYPASGQERRDIFNLAFDPQGNVWVARSDGLFFYDGYSWTRYGRESGLPSDFVRSVCLTREGVLWVGTDRGAGTFDGKRFETHGSETGLAGPSVRRIVEASDGALWFCSDRWPDGSVPAGLAVYRDGVWKQFTAADGLPSPHVHDFFRDSRGREFVMTVRGLAQHCGDRWGPPAVAGFPEGVYARDMVETPDGRLWVSTLDEVYMCDGERWQPMGMTVGKLLVTGDGTLLSTRYDGATRRARVIEWDGIGGWHGVSAWTPMHGWSLEDMKEAPDGSIWGAGNGFFFRWKRDGGETCAHAGLPAPVLVDRLDQVWFADGGKVVVLRGDEFVAGPAVDGPMLGEAGGTLWAAHEGMLVEIDPETLRIVRRHAISAEAVRRLAADGHGRVWLLLREAGQRDRLLSCGEAREWQEAGGAVLAERSVLYLSACPWGGVAMVTERVAGEREVGWLDVGEGYRRVELPAGGDLPVKVYADASALWVLPLRGLWQVPFGESLQAEPLEQFREQSFYSMRRVGRERYFFFDERPADGAEVAVFDGEAWHALGQMHLVGNLVARPEAGIVMAGEGGVHVRLAGEATWRFIPSPAEGVSGPLALRGNGEVWAKQGPHVLRLAGIPAAPRASIRLGAARITEGDRVLVEFAGIDRYEPVSRPEAFAFSWRIDDGAWSPWVRGLDQSGMPDLGRLQPGRHRLWLRVINSAGRMSERPVSVSVSILPIPLQQRPWFLPSVIVVLVGVLGLAIYAMRRAFQLEAARRALEAEVAEHRKTAEAMRAATRELEAFSYSISHDLHAPLRAIAGFAAALEEDCGDRLDEEGRGYLDRIQAASVRMGGLIDALLSLFRLTRRDMQRVHVDLSALAEDILDKLQGGEPGRKCEIRVQPGLVAWADREMLALVMENLLGNAWKYSARGEVTRIEVGRMEVDGEPAFFVRDEGVGFDRGSKIDPFAPFQRLHREDEFTGMGIGLANVQRVIARHGGRVWADSEPGRGATFFFTLGRQERA